MTKIKHILIIILSCMLSSCVSAPCERHADNTSASLAEASYAVSRSIVSLAATAEAAHPCLPKLDPPPNPASYGMAALVSIDWAGPIEPLVCQIAKLTGYRLVVLGTRPAIPVLVSVYDKNTMVADVLRDVGYQAGRRAAVVIYPDCRVIELRYAKN